MQIDIPTIDDVLEVILPVNARLIAEARAADLEKRLSFLTKFSNEQGQAIGTAHNALMDAYQVLGRCLEFFSDCNSPPSLRKTIIDCQRVIDEAIEAIVS